MCVCTDIYPITFGVLVVYGIIEHIIWCNVAILFHIIVVCLYSFTLLLFFFALVSTNILFHFIFIFQSVYVRCCQHKIIITQYWPLLRMSNKHFLAKIIVWACVFRCRIFVLKCINFHTFDLLSCIINVHGFALVLLRLLFVRQIVIVMIDYW